MNPRDLAVPDYAKDLRLNLGKVLESESMTPVQRWGTVLATALASRNRDLIRDLGAAAEKELDETNATAAKTASAIMGMNNVYYRTLHLCGDAELASLPARLRMQGLANHGAETVDFELWCLAVSAINGCGQCLEAHAKTVLDKGGSRQTIQDAVRIASVVHGLAVSIEGEAALATVQA